MGRRASRREKNTPRETVTCPSCAAPIEAHHCASCGEMRPDLRPGVVRDLAADVLEALTSIDGKFLRSMRTLVLRPGVLTAEFLRGARNRYVTPIQMFVLANVVFFVLQGWTGWNSLRSPLNTHLHFSLWSRWARGHVRDFAVAHGTTIDALAEAFDARIENYSKSLLVLLVPMFAVGVWLVCRTRTRSVLAALIFALHLYAFYLWMQGVVVFPVAKALSAGWLGERHWMDVDRVLGDVVVAAITVYDFMALRAAFGFSKRAALLRALALTLVFVVVFFAYRFVLFLIVLHTLPVPR